jgi:hypothetical protein
VDWVGQSEMRDDRLGIRPMASLAGLLLKVVEITCVSFTLHVFPSLKN